MSESKESSLANNGVFLTAIVTALIGCLLKTMSLMYKSKCTVVKICCVKIVRNIEKEVEENNFAITHLPINPPSPNNRI